MNTLGGLSETFPWTLSRRTHEGEYIQWQHGMVPFFGGRSIQWSAWCPEPTPEEMRDWPKQVVKTVQEYFPEAKKLLNVVNADEIDKGRETAPPGGRPIYGVMQKQLTKLLQEEQRRVPIYVCITMRSDFFGACSTFFGLPEAINDGQYLVPRMTREERKEAITGPMRVAGASLSNRLVQRLLNDLGDATADQLPTMQHALMRTFEHWRSEGTSGRPMDVEDYEAVGTIEHALDDHAESVYGDLDEDGRRIA